MENFKIKNKIFFEAGGKREAGRDDKLTIFFMGPNRWHSKRSLNKRCHDIMLVGAKCFRFGWKTLKL
jgi:hypothetical protein